MRSAGRIARYGAAPLPLPPRSSSSAARLSMAARTSSQRSSSHVCTGRPLTAVTTSPPRTPAWYAADVVANGRSRVPGSSLPCMNSAPMTTMARMKLAIGPAATMAMRFHTLWRVNSRGRSASLVGAVDGSRASSILT